MNSHSFGAKDVSAATPPKAISKTTSILIRGMWLRRADNTAPGGVLAAARAGLGICVLQSRVPPGLHILGGRFGLPALPDVEMALVANPRSAREPVQALSSSIPNLRPTPMQP